MLIHEMPEFIPVPVGIGSQYKVTIKTRPNVLTPIFAKARIAGDLSAQTADRWFLATLFALYGRRTFQRRNLDAGRISRVFERELMPADAATFDTTSAEAYLRIEVDGALTYLSEMR